MTSAPITDVPVSSYVQVKNVQPPAGNTANAFSDAMNQASVGKTAAGMSGSEKAADRQDYASKNNVAETTEKPELKTDTADKPEETETVTPATDDEEAMQKVDEKTQELAGEIADELDVTVEEVIEAMQQLGLTAMDLIQPGNMAQLTAQLTGNEVVDVLTQEDLFASVDMLCTAAEDTMKQLADELGMSRETLAQLIDEQISKMPAEREGVQLEIEGTLSDTQQTLEEMKQPKELGQQTEMTSAPEQKVQETLHQTQETPVENASQEKPQNQEIPPQVNTTENASPKKQEKGSENGQGMQQGVLTGAVTENALNNALKAADVQPFGESFDMARTREIIDQIADYVKINNHAQVSEMEIQLNPANLGTVNLQVASKNGTITAQLTVQDEAVRAALETQALQLKESLQEQGLKVEAVEVTIASHEFEQNLDQNGRENDQTGESKKPARRILNLDELPEEDGYLEEDMSEADRLQIEMMRMGGNKLDFQI